MNRAAVKLLVLQAHKLLGMVIDRWNDADEELQGLHVDGVVDDDVVRQERLREQLRRRGVNV